MTEPARTRVTAFGAMEGVTEAVALIGRTGARSFELLWTHPEYPMTVDEEPPGGVDVVWTVGAEYEIRRRGRRPVRLVRTASARSVDGDHGEAILAVCLDLLRDLGANVTTFGDRLRPERVETPAEAIAHLEDGHS